MPSMFNYVEISAPCETTDGLNQILFLMRIKRSIMGLLHWLKREGDGNGRISESPMPVFEQLEPRILLSADASPIHDVQVSASMYVVA
jgi:hypothetical protein